jgi:2-oxoisovalerate dehydrogenase E1 component
MASFGDASVNHSTAQGAFNAAGWAGYQGAACPILFVCEDNGIGISTKSPQGWIAANLQGKPGVKYFAGDGLDFYDCFRAASEAADYVRTKRKPAMLHLRMVRLYGHAGADVPTTYLSREEVEADEAQDPLLHAARLMEAAGVMDRGEALGIYRAAEAEVVDKAARAVQRPRLARAAEVMASILPPGRGNLRRNDQGDRAALFGAEVKAMAEPQPMSRLINWALHDLMREFPETVLMGEDVGRKGGVYGVTQRLAARFGRGRVIDTLLDEQSILGLAIGMAQNGFVPLPEIQFLAYLHNAEDQLRGEAASLPFFSQGQFTNPMVLRIAGLGYQKGFGGHFHNDNSLAVLRDIPGVILAVPSTGPDAAMMLREAVRLAREESRVVVVVEPIALYPMRDLLAEKDGGWMGVYPAPERRIGWGEVGVTGAGPVAIVTYGNGHYLAHQARAMVPDLDLRIIDLRWLAPLPFEGLQRALQGASRVLFVDECRRSGNVSEALMTWGAEVGLPRMARLTAEDSFIATGPAYAATLPSAAGIVAALRGIM